MNGRRTKNLNQEKYTRDLPYLVNGKLRKDHYYRVLAEKSFYKKHCQDQCLSNPRVLDIGCHDGQILKLITGEIDAQLTGIDILENVVSEAKSRGIDASVANIERGMPFNDSYFDILFAGEIIEHLYDPKKALQEANRVLSENGGLILSVPNICSLRNRARILLGKLPHHYNSSAQEKWGDHIRLFTAKSLIDLLGQTGFNTTSISSNGLFGSGFVRETYPNLGDLLVIYATKSD